jgi:nucleotide-binding universal stress UspA family protein
MTGTFDEKATLLIDVALPEPDRIPLPLRAQMGALKVVLVGWYAVPEQTSPEQARDQFEGEAQAALDRVADTLRTAGIEVQTHVVFTGNELDTIERISAEQDCDAILIPAPIDHLERILVPMRGLHNAERIARFVAHLVQDGTTDVTLLHILEEGEEEDAVQHDVLDKVSTMMVEAGIAGGLIRLRVEVADDPGDAIINIAKAYNAVVIGETEPSMREIIFGNVPEQIAHEAEVPVMVVRRRHEKNGSG